MEQCNINTSYRGKGGAGEEFLPKGLETEGEVFVYVRRSAEDRTNRPLGVQIEVINNYVKDCMKGKRIRKYFGDNGVSGSTPIEKRDGMKALMKEIEEYSNTKEGAEKPPHVVVYDSSRLARDVQIGSFIKSSLEHLGVILHLAQNRMVVEGANADMFFGLTLQMATSERTATISRVRISLQNKDWDPRKSYGWKFEGQGNKPTEIKEEQEILKEIRKMYEEDGMNVKDIMKQIKEKYGETRRSRETNLEEEKTIKWKTSDISFLSKKHKWKWGGGYTFNDLENDIQEAKLLKTENGERVYNIEKFLKENKHKYYDGVKVNKTVVGNLFGEEIPEWKIKAINLARSLLRQEKYSNDDIINLFDEKIPRPGGWPRQTGWRLINEARRQNEKAFKSQYK